jgi:hypothetical protein
MRGAGNRGILVLKIEGGISSGGTFEARLDAIRDEVDPPLLEKNAAKNNRAAANFIRSRNPGYNAFIITSCSFIESPSAADRALPVR